MASKIHRIRAVGYRGFFMKDKTAHTLYGNFQDILTGYRLTTVLMQVHESGVMACIGDDGASGDDICGHAGWEKGAGSRFLETLCGIDLLCREDGLFFMTAFSRRFLLKGSNHYQGDALEFEKKLIDSWGMLGDTLQSGRREYGAEEKSPEEYRQAVETYMGAMDNAARERSTELWDMLPVGGEKNVSILDIGAGSGAYLKEFLGRYSGWRGIFCDLTDIVERAKVNPELSLCRDRITFLPCNLLDPDSLVKAVQGIDQLYHLAALFAIWTKDPDLHFKINVDGARAMMNAAKAAGDYSNPPLQIGLHRLLPGASGRHGHPGFRWFQRITLLQ